MVVQLCADVTVGKLARWLRFLGYDVLEVAGSQAEVAYVARSQGRVLISRDHRLAHRPGLRVILVKPTDLAEQLALVIQEVGRLPPGTPPRCMRCNEALVQLDPEQARLRLPSYLLRTQTQFRRCPKCGKIYWRGTHWQAIEERVARVLASLSENARTP